MQFLVMDKELIDIYNIKNIESIKVFDVMSNSGSKILLIPAILIFYDGGKTMCLCNEDKYFDVFVRKVVEVYNLEKDKVIDDSLTNPFGLEKHIDIDEFSKKILASGELEKIVEVYKFYQEKNSYDQSLFFQIDEVKMLMPIVIYHIKKLFSNTNKVVNISDKIEGYRERYFGSAKIDGVEMGISIYFQKVDNQTYEFSIGGLLDKSIPVLMRVSFFDDVIEVKTGITEYDFISYASYQIEDEVVREVYRVKKDDVTIAYENKECPLTDNEYQNITNIDGECLLKWYLLPWKALYGFKNDTLDISKEEKIIEIHSMYLSVFNDSFFKKEYYSKVYRRKETSSVNKLDITLDEMKKNMIGILIKGLDNVFVLETNFVEDGKSGYYKQYLKDKYFYHLVLSDNGLLGLNKDDLVSVNQDDDIIISADLLNKDRVLRLVRGD